MNHASAHAPQTGTYPLCFVRVLDTLASRFVQFEFTLGERDLSVELVMQYPQFLEFCERHHAVHLAAEEHARPELERMRWRQGLAPERPHSIHPPLERPCK